MAAEPPNAARGQAFFFLFLLFFIFIVTPGYLTWERIIFENKSREAEAISLLAIAQQREVLQSLKNEAIRSSPKREYFIVIVPLQVGKQAIDSFLEGESGGAWNTDRWWCQGDRRRRLIFIARRE